MCHFRLKSFNTPEHQVYTVEQINTYPIPIYAVQVVSSPYCLYAYFARYDPHLRQHSTGMGLVVRCVENALATYHRRWGECNHVSCD